MFPKYQSMFSPGGLGERGAIRFSISVSNIVANVARAILASTNVASTQFHVSIKQKCSIINKVKTV